MSSAMSSVTSSIMASGDLERRVLEESLAVVTEQSYLMKQAIDSGNIRDVLKHSSTLIGELRTSALCPKNYYELYMKVFQELTCLHEFFSDRVRRRRRLSELYESVQHAGNIIPRLYLLVCVGAACIREREIAPRETLIDLSELCKGVQQPLRGLFLRYFLVQMVKDVLPDCGDPEYPDWPATPASDGATPITSAEVSFEFLFNNFVEATKLWRRIHYQSPVKDRTKRDSDRHSMRVLIGANLVCIAQLECMTVEFYKTVALPKLIEQIKGLNDLMALEYTLESIVQVFSDECHIATLQPLCDCIVAINSAVDVKVILGNLLDRLKLFLTSLEFQAEEPASIPCDQTAAEKGTKESSSLPPSSQSSPTTSKTAVAGETLGREVAMGCEVDDVGKATVDISKEADVGRELDQGRRVDEEPHGPDSGNRTGTPSNRSNKLAMNGIVETHLSSEFSVDHRQLDLPTGQLEAPPDSARSVSAPNQDSPPPPPPPPPAPPDSSASSSLRQLESALSKNESLSKRDRQALLVFATLREGLMDLIQKAYDDDFRFPPSTKPSSSSTKAQQIYRLTVTDILQILQSFLDFTLTVFPDRVDLADSVYQLVYPLVSVVGGSLLAASTGASAMQQSDFSTIIPSEPPSSAPCSGSSSPCNEAEPISNLAQVLSSLLSEPFRQSGYGCLIYGKHYSKLLECLPNDAKMSVVRGIVTAMLVAEEPILDWFSCSKLYTLLGLVLSTPRPASNPVELKQWIAEVEMVSALSHLIKDGDTDLHFSMLLSAKQSLMAGHADTYIYTLPPLVTCWLTLIPQIQIREPIAAATASVSTPELTSTEPTAGGQPTPSSTAEQQLDPSQQQPEAPQQHREGVPQLDPSQKQHEAAQQQHEAAQQQHEASSVVSDHEVQSSPQLSPSHNLQCPDQPPSASAAPSTATPAAQPGITARRVLQQIHGTCVDLMEHGHSEMAFRLLLLAAESTAQAERNCPGNYGSICNEFLKQAVVCYEEDMTDNRCRVKALPLLIGTLSTAGRLCLDSEAYDSLVSFPLTEAEKSTRHAAKLLKSSDQCKAVLLCSHLFFDPENESRSDICRVLECLQRCLKLASDTIEFNIMDVVLLVDVLEKYLFYFEGGPDVGGIPPEAVSSLIRLCAEQLAFAAESSATASSESARKAIQAAQKHLSNLVEYIRATAMLDPTSKFHFPGVLMSDYRLLNALGSLCIHLSILLQSTET